MRFLLVGSYAVVWAIAAIVLGWSNPAPDWLTFLRTGHAVLEGQPWYVVPPRTPPNLTPPLMAPLFALFSLLPVRVSYLVWTLFGISIVFVISRAIARRVGWQSRYVAVGLLALHGATMGLLLGQLQFVIFALVTLAWLADRDGRMRTAGAWLGIALYLKPFAGLLVVYWAWRRNWTAAITAAGLALFGYALGAVLSWSNTRDWLLMLSNVSWQHVSINLSLWGWVARMGAPLWLAVPAIGVVLIVLLWRLPRLTLDQAWAAVYLSALLVSPISWIYYALPLVGPLLVVYDQGGRTTRALLVAGYVGMCVPLSFQPTALDAGGWQAGTLGSFYLCAAFCWWVAAQWPTSLDRPSAVR